MKSKLFFLSLSTAFAICANANAAPSIGADEFPEEPDIDDSYKGPYQIKSVTANLPDGSKTNVDVSRFVDYVRFNPFRGDDMNKIGEDMDGNYINYDDTPLDKLYNLPVSIRKDGTLDITIGGFTINMETPYTFEQDPDIDEGDMLNYSENYLGDYVNAVLGAYEGLRDNGLIGYEDYGDDYEEGSIKVRETFDRIFGELSDMALNGDYDTLCGEKIIGCAYFAGGFDNESAGSMFGFTIDDYYDYYPDERPSEPDNGGSDSNNGNQGSSGREETKPDTGSSSGTGSSTGSSSGTTSGSGSSTTGTTTMPTGHRTFYAPAEAAADVHEGKDNTVIISF